MKKVTQISSSCLPRILKFGAFSCYNDKNGGKMSGFDDQYIDLCQASSYSNVGEFQDQLRYRRGTLQRQILLAKIRLQPKEAFRKAAYPRPDKSGRQLLSHNAHSYDFHLHVRYRRLMAADSRHRFFGAVPLSRRA